MEFHLFILVHVKVRLIWKESAETQKPNAAVKNILNYDYSKVVVAGEYFLSFGPLQVRECGRISSDGLVSLKLYLKRVSEAVLSCPMHIIALLMVDWSAVCIKFFMAWSCRESEQTRSILSLVRLTIPLACVAGIIYEKISLPLLHHVSHAEMTSLHAPSHLLLNRIWNGHLSWSCLWPLMLETGVSHYFCLITTKWKRNAKWMFFCYTSH